MTAPEEAETVVEPEPAGTLRPAGELIVATTAAVLLPTVLPSASCTRITGWRVKAIPARTMSDEEALPEAAVPAFVSIAR